MPQIKQPVDWSSIFPPDEAEALVLATFEIFTYRNQIVVPILLI